MRRVLQRSLLIVFGSAALGLVVNAFSPRGIPLVAQPQPPPAARDVVPLTEARELWQTGAGVFLDARSPADYAAGHVANALSLPAEEFDVHLPQVAPMLAPEMPIVVYCNGERCDLSHEVQTKLRGLGFKNVRVLINGWTVWQQAGLPAAKGAPL